MIKQIEQTLVDGCLVLHMNQHIDARGSFQEVFNEEDLYRIGLFWEFKQANISVSMPKVLRGLHLQRTNPQGKLVQCLQGKVFDVCVDLRPDSISFLKWHGEMLGSQEPKAMFIPPGCAHGFYAMNWAGEPSMLLYLCTEIYDNLSDGGIRWDDPQININWPIKLGVEPTVSPKDQALPTALEYIKSLE